MRRNNKNGFTLIETVIYIALLGLLMTGVVATAYQLLQGSATISVKTAVQDEGSFVLRKIEWAMSGASDISGSGSSLTVSRYDGNTVSFRLNGTAVEVKESAFDNTYRPLTTSANVAVQTFVVSVTGSSPKQLTVTMTIKTAHGTDAPQTFTLTRYLRK